jgi:hypothetical protein
MFLVPTQSNLYRLNLMACEKKCPNCKCKEDQSTKAFRKFVEENPSSSAAKIYDV